MFGHTESVKVFIDEHKKLLKIEIIKKFRD